MLVEKYDEPMAHVQTQGTERGHWSQAQPRMSAANHYIGGGINTPLLASINANVENKHLSFLCLLNHLRLLQCSVYRLSTLKSTNCHKKT